MKRTLIVIAVVTLVIVGGGWAYFAVSSGRPGQINADKFISASRSYAEGLRGQGLPVPASVSMKELIARGLLSDADVKGFSAMEVTVNLSVDETRPQEVLVMARLSDGQKIVCLADGSVQQVGK